MRIGIDLGGTKIEAIALDAVGTTLARRRVATPAGDYAGTLRAIADLVAAIEAETGQAGTIGVGTPGAISPRTGLIKNANSIVLNGKPLDRDLADLLGRPVALENDANCFALSEATDGAGAGGRVVFGVILGTGVGGGLVVDGRILRGANAIAGEWGHNPLPWAGDAERPGAPCYCGRSGCIETFLSGAGLRRLDPLDRSGETIARVAAEGDASAKAALDLYRDRLARALASVINILDPDVIVLGGGLSNIAALYDGLAALVSRACFSDGVDTPILRHAHGDSSGVRGAAWLGATAG
jgi:fructokinase